MKVLNPGSGSGGWSAQVRCSGRGNGGGGCGADLLLSAADLYTTYEFEREGRGAPHTTFQCPLCRRQTDIATPPVVATGPLPDRTAWEVRQKAAATARYMVVADTPVATFRDNLTERTYILVGGPGDDRDGDRTVLGRIVAALNRPDVI